MASSSYVLVHIVTKLELGGAQLATLHQIEHAAFGVRPHHLIFGPGGMLDAPAHGMADVRLWPVPALSGPLHATRDAQALCAIACVLRRIQRGHPGCPLLVHTHSSKAGILGRWAAALVGVRCIVHTIHGFGHQKQMGRGLFGALWVAERLSAAVTHGYTADSQANLDRGLAERLLAGKPTCVVRCGIDLAAYTTARVPAGLRATLGVADQDAIVLSVACLKAQKDPLTWVRVAARVLAERPNTTFLWAGDGLLRPALQAAIARAGLGAKCRLLGWRRDIPSLLHLCDVVLHTSLWEGLPQVFAQAMACGRPIVATCVDGAPEAIEAGVTGLLRAAADDAGLAADTLALLRDSGRAKSMGAIGAGRADSFSQARMLADLVTFYRQLTGA